MDNWAVKLRIIGEYHTDNEEDGSVDVQKVDSELEPADRFRHSLQIEKLPANVDILEFVRLAKTDNKRDYIFAQTQNGDRYMVRGFELDMKKVFGLPDKGVIFLKNTRTGKEIPAKILDSVNNYQITDDDVLTGFGLATAGFVTGQPALFATGWSMAMSVGAEKLLDQKEDPDPVRAKIREAKAMNAGEKLMGDAIKPK